MFTNLFTFLFQTDAAATTQGIVVSREIDKEDGRQTTTVQPAGITHDVILTDIQPIITKAAEPSAAETTQAALSTDVQAVAAQVAEQPDDATQAAVHAQVGTAAVEQPKLATSTTTSTSAAPSTSAIASTPGSSSTAATTTVHPLCLVRIHVRALTLAEKIHAKRIHKLRVHSARCMSA